jgi:hypothetical protein
MKATAARRVRVLVVQEESESKPAHTAAWHPAGNSRSLKSPAQNETDGVSLSPYRLCIHMLRPDWNHRLCLLSYSLGSHLDMIRIRRPHRLDDTLANSRFYYDKVSLIASFIALILLGVSQ